MLVTKKSDNSELTNIHDIKNILKNTFNKNNLLVTLKKNKIKGNSLFSIKNIKKGDVVAYYKVKIYSYKKDPVSIWDDKYTVGIDGYPYLYADLYEGSLNNNKTENNIPYWGYFSNEPNENQKCNVDLFIKDDKVKRGDTINLYLEATRDIKIGEEIVWYYGPNYKRDYVVNLKDC